MECPVAVAETLGCIRFAGAELRPEAVLEQTDLCSLNWSTIAHSQDGSSDLQPGTESQLELATFEWNLDVVQLQGSVLSARHPQLMLAGAEAAGARFVFTDNLYMVRWRPPLHEDLPLTDYLRN